MTRFLRTSFSPISNCIGTSNKSILIGIGFIFSPINTENIDINIHSQIIINQFMKRLIRRFLIVSDKHKSDISITKFFNISGRNIIKKNFK